METRAVCQELTKGWRHVVKQWIKKDGSAFFQIPQKHFLTPKKSTINEGIGFLLATPFFSGI